MSVEQLPPPPAPIDERQQMMLQARAHTIGHCESRLVDFRASGRAWIVWFLCNVFGAVVAFAHVAMSSFTVYRATEAYFILGFANILSLPLGMTFARGTYRQVIDRYKDDKKAAGLADI